MRHRNQSRPAVRPTVAETAAASSSDACEPPPPDEVRVLGMVATSDTSWRAASARSARPAASIRAVGELPDGGRSAG